MSDDAQNRLYLVECASKPCPSSASNEVYVIAKNPRMAGTKAIDFMHENDTKYSSHVRNIKCIAGENIYSNDVPLII